jgi:hypothetical protein
MRRALEILEKWLKKIVVMRFLALESKRNLRASATDRIAMGLRSSSFEDRPFWLRFRA